MYILTFTISVTALQQAAVRQSIRATVVATVVAIVAATVATTIAPPRIHRCGLLSRAYGVHTLLLTYRPTGLYRIQSSVRPSTTFTIHT